MTSLALPFSAWTSGHRLENPSPTAPGVRRPHLEPGDYFSNTPTKTASPSSAAPSTPAFTSHPAAPVPFSRVCNCQCCPSYLSVSLSPDSSLSVRATRAPLHHPTYLPAAPPSFDFSEGPTHSLCQKRKRTGRPNWSCVGTGLKKKKDFCKNFKLLF